ncbi:MAG: hypothetical protein HY874_07435, partial [Chloroflexi bacterium]|nr:hypothetical protein [Chloroflexota bacterium]
MNTIDLATAVSHIRQVVLDEHRGSEWFFFVVGAGISVPSVPVAQDLEREFRRVAEEYRRTEPPPRDNALDRYSHWFSQAYPQRRQRRDYLRTLIEKKAVTQANLRLAHILLDGRVTRLVVTPNFDDLLARGLRLIGAAPIVCDHPSTVARIEIGGPDVQLVHVHGTYWFYDCCNLGPEIEDRAAHSEETILTMSALLDNILADKSPLVVGYGGWDGDVIMTALRRRLNAGIRSNVYWFCHTRDEATTLPRWLVEHPSVYMVMPPAEDRSPNRRAVDLGQTQQSLSSPKERSALRAEEVFSALLQAIGAEVPLAIRNPVAFLAGQLRDQVDTGSTTGSPDDSYGLASVIERADAAARHYEEELARSDNIEHVRDLLRQSLFREAIHAIDGLDRSNLTERELSDLAALAWDAAYGLFDDSEDELLGYDLVVRLVDGMTLVDLSERVRTAKAVRYKALTLGELGRRDEALAAYDEVVQRYGEETETELRMQVAMALVNKGYQLRELGRRDDALAVYDEVVRRYGEATDVESREHAAMALVNKGFQLGELGRGDEALAAYDEVVLREGEATQTELRKQVARALVSKGDQLGELGRR